MTKSNGQAFFASIVAALGGFLFGLDIGYIAPIMDCTSFKRDVAHLTDWEDPHSKIHSGQAGFLVGIFSIGCLISAFPPINSYFLDTWGRRDSIALGGSIFLVGCILQAQANSFSAIYAGRFIAGLAIGLLSSVVPLYQAELASPGDRGRMTCLYQLMITFGVFVAALADQVLIWKDGGWRTAIWLQAIPASSLVLLVPLLPRSPRWLLQQGRIVEALESLQRLRDLDEANKEHKEMVEAHKKMSKVSEKPRWAEIFTGRVGKLVGIGVSLQLLQQFVGVNVVLYFGPRIFDSIGVDPIKFQTLNNAFFFLSSFPALYLADHAGRIVLLKGGGFCMCVTSLALGLLGSFFAVHVEGGAWLVTDSTAAGSMAAMVLLFVASFAMAWGPVVWMYCSEIFPLQHRARCIAITTMSNWIGNYTVAQFAPIALENLGFGTFFITASFSLLAMRFAYQLPETKGVLLEHIDNLFDEQVENKGLLSGTDKSSYGLNTKA